MKIKIDFVSNSSSTSFVYILQEKLTKDVFFDAIGVSTTSPAAPMFQEMFEQLRTRIEGGERLTSVEDIDALEGSREFMPEVLTRMREAMEQGKIVSTGHLSSEEGLAEGILCTEIFEINSERFFINAYDNYWWFWPSDHAVQGSRMRHILQCTHWFLRPSSRARQTGTLLVATRPGVDGHLHHQLVR